MSDTLEALKVLASGLKVIIEVDRKFALQNACEQSDYILGIQEGLGKAHRYVEMFREEYEKEEKGEHLLTNFRPTGAVTRFCECGGPQIDVLTDGKREVAKCPICGKVWDMKTYEEIKL